MAISPPMKNNRRWLIANWKMHGNPVRVHDYAYAVNAALSAVPATLEVVFCPPALYSATAMAALPHNRRLQLGAQNCHAFAEGAHTGEISAPMLAEMGIAYVIVGHSERRARGENDGDVAAKAAAAIDAGLMPVICVGEQAADYESKRTEAVLKEQLAVLKQLPSTRYLIAYEPVWAIGTGKTPSSAEIIAAHRAIKSVLGSETAVLYGGSVNAGNAKEILGLAEVSGALIGGASLEVASMKTLIATACGIMKE